MKIPNSRATCMVVTGSQRSKTLDAERKYRDYPKMTCCRAGESAGEAKEDRVMRVMGIYLIRPRMLRFVRLAFCECQLIASMKMAISAASTGTYQIKGMRSKREITNAPMVPCSRKRIANTSHKRGALS